MGENSRTITPNGERIRELRKAQGWTQEELADAATVSLKTISKCEAGDGPLFIGTVRRIADALDVGINNLVKDRTEARPPPLRKLILILPGDLDAIDHYKQLLDLIAALEERAGVDGIEVVRIESGSVKLTVVLTKEDAARVMAAFLEGRLDGLGIDEVIEVEDVRDYDGRMGSGRPPADEEEEAD